MRHELRTSGLDGLQVASRNVNICAGAFVAEGGDRELQNVGLGVVEYDGDVSAVVCVRG